MWCEFATASVPKKEGGFKQTMKVCPKCGFREDPMWKPLAWRIYWDYADLDSFVRGYPQLSSFALNPPEKQKCEQGNFYFHFEDEYYYYQVTTPKSKRQLVRRFPKGYESMANRELFEKTPSEKDTPDIFQKRLLEVENHG